MNLFTLMFCTRSPLRLYWTFVSKPVLKFRGQGTAEGRKIGPQPTWHKRQISVADSRCQYSDLFYSSLMMSLVFFLFWLRFG